jgi:alpha-N-arabinofuranosidase
MKIAKIVCVIAIALQIPVFCVEPTDSNRSPIADKIIHVGKSGNDSNAGNADSPLLTISAASKVAMPGDEILVHEGTYREWVRPERGGTSEGQRISYRAAPGEKVYLKGSERITNWVQLQPGVWMIELPNTYFGDYNPYALTISGGWLEYGKWRHRGCVYLNGTAYYEVESINELVVTKNSWQAYTAEKTTTIHANFGNVDPNQELAEINVRESVFMPNRTGVNYITVDGFHITQAATNWTPPSQELQMGAIGPRLGKNWIIENCNISHAKSTGIVLGSAPGVDYTDIGAYGGHLIRNNSIHHCGQGGIIGKFGATRSTITGNLIEEINYLREFGGWETAAIKFHHSVDVEISNNVIRGVRNSFSCAGFGIWIDFGNQGTRISRNIIYDVDNYCIHLEMNHGPMLLDHNIFVGDTSGVAAKGADFSQHKGGVNTSTDGVVYAHNLFVDANQAYTEFTTRSADYFKPHTAIKAGSRDGTHREDKWFNNIFIRRGLDHIPYLRYVAIPGAGSALKIKAEDFMGAPGMLVDYNLFLEAANGSSFGDAHSVVDSFPTEFKIESRPSGVTIQFLMNKAYRKVKSPMVDQSLVGIFSTTGQTIEDKDGRAITVNTDFNGKVFEKPTVGPISNLSEGANMISWDINH